MSTQQQALILFRAYLIGISGRDGHPSPYPTDSQASRLWQVGYIIGHDEHAFRENPMFTFP